MDLLQLIYFKRAAELGNISAAAREFHVVQSAVSTQIKNLEYELGAPFFERAHNKLVLNDNGRILYRYANEILGQFKDAGKELADIGGKKQKELILSVETIPILLPEIIHGFCLEHPDIKIRLLQYQKDFEMENLDYDLMLGFSQTAEEEENAIRIYEEEILLAVPRLHPLAQRASVSLKELSGEAFIERSPLSELRAVTEVYFRNFVPNVVTICDYPPLINALIASGVGMAFLPRLSAVGEGAEDFALVRIEDFSLRRWIYMKWRKDSYQSEPMQIFLQYVKDYFQKFHERG